MSQKTKCLNCPKVFGEFESEWQFYCSDWCADEYQQKQEVQEMREELIQKDDKNTYSYKGAMVKIIRATFPRYGHRRVVIERLSDHRRFTVTVKELR